MGRSEELRKYIQWVKESSRCADCAENDFIVLEFDHLPQFRKKFNVSQAPALGVSLDQLKEEILKCEIVCSNCHRRRTRKRLEQAEKQVFVEPVSPPTDFRDWCLTRRQQNTPEGDFIEDVKALEACKEGQSIWARRRLPKNLRSAEALLTFLRSVGACHEAQEAAYSLWKRYTRQMKALS